MTDIQGHSSSVATPVSAQSIKYRDEKRIVDYFLNLLENRLSGRDLLRVINRQPVDVCHLGVLGPWHHEVDEPDSPEDGEVVEAEENQQQEEQESQVQNRVPVASNNQGQRETGVESNRGSVDGNEDHDYTRRPPSSQGFEILVQPEDDEVEIEVGVHFAIYTKHLPTLKEQRESLGGSSDELAPEGDMTLAEVCERRNVDVSGLRFRIRKSSPYKIDDRGAVQQVLDTVIAEAMSSPDILPIFPTTPKVPAEIMTSEPAFQAWLQANTQGLSVARPTIRASLETHVHPQYDNLRISSYLRNNTQRGTKRTEDNYNILADVRLTVRIIRGILRPVEILPIPEDYQYDRSVWAVGHNTSVEVSEDRRSVETRALARFEQPRLTTQSDPPARFDDLVKAPFDVLEKIYQAMEAYAERWEGVISSNSLGLDPDALEECQKDLEGFRREAERFACGIAALEADERLLRAFSGMNQVMGRLAKGYDCWRLFQIVFIVTQLPSLALREGKKHGEWPKGVERNWAGDLEWGDVLWFATGGGKTEAYLGLVCCAMLYDRLRGKSLGITAWLRFPLRMLSVQQLQRAMRMVWEAEKERQSLLGAEAELSDPIRLGYLVGGTTTPNQLNDYFFQRHSDAESCENYAVVPDCPACGEEGAVRAIPDPNNSRIRHICQECHTQLPLVVSDEEVYRYLPSLIIGTIDKMATVGLQPKFGILWSGPKWCCPKHGYGLGEYCLYGCNVKPKQRRTIVVYDPGPSFHIQDELHLLQEELGAFAGHYETLTRQCEKLTSSQPAKIVAATATIQGFEHQVRHLYGVKGARRFPGRGYDRYESFYATLEKDPDVPGKPKTSRVFVAFRPASGSPSDAAAQCTKILHEAIGSLIDEPYGALAAIPTVPSGDSKALRELLFYYSATLSYVGSLTGGTRVKDLLLGVAQTVYQGIRSLNVEYLSSRSSSSEVSTVIHRMDQPPQWEDPFHLDSIVATNMISHGVDLERINMMVMDRFPAETAEYIQASSRSGRKKVGLVVVVLPSYNMRAISIYNRFREYHQHLDRMVSPVPVNRFAKYAIHRTIPGVLSGLLFGAMCPGNNTMKYQYLRDALNWIDTHKQEVEEKLRAAYALGEDIYEGDLEDAMSDSMIECLESLLVTMRPSQERRLTDSMRPKPMTSLRDVDRGIPFYPESRDPYFLGWFRRGGD